MQVVFKQDLSDAGSTPIPFTGARQGVVFLLVLETELNYAVKVFSNLTAAESELSHILKGYETLDDRTGERRLVTKREIRNALRWAADEGVILDDYALYRIKECGAFG